MPLDLTPHRLQKYSLVQGNKFKKGKSYENLIILSLVSVLIQADPQPEFYFHINDPEYGHTYYIGAVKVGTDPLYIWDTSIYPNRYSYTNDENWLNTGSMLPLEMSTRPLGLQQGKLNF